MLLQKVKLTIDELNLLNFNYLNKLNRFQKKTTILKNYIPIIIAFLFTTLGFAQNPIEGHWLLEKVIEKGVTKNINRPVHFNLDGKLYMMEKTIGTWQYHATDNTLFLNTGVIEGKHQIIKNEMGKLVIQLNNTSTYFTKIDKDKISLENKKSGLEGVWVLDGKINDYLKLYIRFTLPNNLIIVEISKNSKSTSKGNWIAKTQEKTVNLIGILNYLKGENTLVEVSKDKLLIKNNDIVYHFNKSPNADVIEYLTFLSEDFDDKNGNYKYENEAQKLPWKEPYQIIQKLSKVKQLVYTYSELINEINVFNTQVLYANIITDIQKNKLKMDDIFQGFDINTLPEDTEMPVLEYNEYSSPLFPIKNNTFRVVKQEKINVPAGDFLCTVVEILINSDIRQKIWFINNQPGIIAKIINEKSGSFGHYNIYELKEIK